MESYQLKTHGNKILALLGQVVSSLNNLDYIKPTLSLFGEQHIAWHVQEGFFDEIAKAALMTFKEDMAEDWTESLQHSWETFFYIVNEIMLMKWQNRKSHIDWI